MGHQEDLLMLYLNPTIPTYRELMGDAVMPAIEQLVVQYHPEYQETWNDKQ